MELSLSWGGGARRGARLEMINREKKDIQKVECSAFQVTRKLNWLVNTYSQVRCNTGWIRVGMGARSGTGILFAGSSEMREARSCARQGQD
eukprot:1490602-Pyramimonas_sp.AAC.1